MKKGLITLIRVAQCLFYSVLSEQAQESGDEGEEVTPVPIPNTEVKLFSADGSWGFPPARVGRRRAQGHCQ